MAAAMAAVRRQEASLAPAGEMAPPELDAATNPAAMLCCGGRVAVPPYNMCQCDGK